MPERAFLMRSTDVWVDTSQVFWVRVSSFRGGIATRGDTLPDREWRMNGWL